MGENPFSLSHTLTLTQTHLNQKEVTLRKFSKIKFIKLLCFERIKKDFFRLNH